MNPIEILSAHRRYALRRAIEFAPVSTTTL